MNVVGSTWLKEKYNLNNFDLSHESYIASSYKKETDQFGNVVEHYPKHYMPKDNVFAHIEFSLKYDDFSLDFLSIIFQLISTEEIENFILNSPKGRFERKLGFLYEFITSNKLNIQNVEIGNYVDLLNGDKYILGKVVKDKRWKVNNNLLGNANYCPIIRKTKALDSILDIDYRNKIEDVTKSFSEEIFYRAVNYLYTKETRSSYQIEKEIPTQDRINRFIQLLRMAGSKPIEQTLREQNLVNLQNEIIERRFADEKFRDFQNYVGEATITYKEKVHYVCPPPSIINSIMDGYLNSAIKTENIPTILKAGMIAFGFVFAHPFSDGNGRLHRFLIHDALNRDRLVPEGMIVPISARMLMNMREYDNALERYSLPLLKRITYNIDEKGILEVTNTKDVEGYFRYPELTSQCIYLGKTLFDSIEIDLHNELEFIFRYDDIKKVIQEIVDMPGRLIDLSIKFLHQNNGKISRRKRMDLEMLTDEEIEKMENAFRRIFGNDLGNSIVPE
jgi:hypothetical protein